MFFLNNIAYVKEFDLNGLLASFVIFILCMTVPFIIAQFTPYKIKFRKGVRAYKVKDYNEAADQFSQCIKKKPSDRYAYYNRGLAYLRLKQYDKSIKDFHFSAKTYPFSYHPYFGLSLVYWELKNYSLVEEYLNKVLEFKLPKKIKAFMIHDKGICLSKQKKYDSALENYFEAARLNNKLAEPYNSIGYYYLIHNNFNEAIKYFDLSLTIKKNFAFAYNNRGFAYANLGNFERAYSDFTESQKLKPDNAYLYKHRGLTYLMDKQYEKALIELKKAVEMEHEFEEQLSEKIRQCKANLNQNFT